MNIQNAALAAVAAAHLGIPHPQSSDAIARFLGVHNRQQRHTIGQYTVVTDKASHPIALRALFEATRQAYPGRRIVSVIQPRGTGGKNWIYQRDLPAALDSTDQVVVISAAEHNPEPGRKWKGGPFSTDALMSDLARRGVPSTAVKKSSGLSNALPTCLRPDDVIVLSLPEQETGILATVTEALRD